MTHCWLHQVLDKLNEIDRARDRNKHQPSVVIVVEGVPHPVGKIEIARDGLPYAGAVVINARNYLDDMPEPLKSK